MTIPLSWAFIHTIFTLHYAHEYYGEHRGSEGGLRFPGKDADYWDFVYFSFGIGMSAQVSDVAVTEKRIRRIVMFHSIMAFFFNVTLLALTMNLVGDAIQNGRRAATPRRCGFCRSARTAARYSRAPSA